MPSAFAFSFIRLIKSFRGMMHRARASAASFVLLMRDISRRFSIVNLTHIGTRVFMLPAFSLSSAEIAILCVLKLIHFSVQRSYTTRAVRSFEREAIGRGVWSRRSARIYFPRVNFPPSFSIFRTELISRTGCTFGLSFCFAGFETAGASSEIQSRGRLRRIPRVFRRATLTELFTRGEAIL